MSWAPTISLQNLRQRAQIIAQIRQFFAERDILEVETPLLSAGTITDPNIFSLEVKVNGLAEKNNKFYLQTSPEFAMKRLLCAGSGAIYQICKAFRDGEAGRRHNPEFTMLEWYRPDFDHRQLMQEIDVFLQTILQAAPAEYLSYQQAFIKYLNIDPLAATVPELKTCAAQQALGDLSTLETADKDTWLNLLISHCVEPHLGIRQPTFLYDFPASQAALAKIRQDRYPVAERFEIFVNGMELGNGFHELLDAREQRLRFKNDLMKRAEANIPSVAIDNNFLAALEHGLPNSAGVAIGIDRLMMLALKTTNIADVIAFPITRA